MIQFQPVETPLSFRRVPGLKAMPWPVRVIDIVIDILLPGDTP
jgi:hypothetical protein